MTNEQWRKEALGGCSMAAEDCKGNADYAAYGFKKGDEASAREHVFRLKSSLRKLESEMSMLDRANKRLDVYGAGSEVDLSAPI